MKNELNENEIKVLQAVKLAIVKCTGNEFCYADEIQSDKFTTNQIKGYLSQLLQKQYISIIPDKFRQMFFTKKASQYIDIEQFTID